MTHVVRGFTVVVALTSIVLVVPALAEAQGIGVGVKGGYLHSSFDVSNAFDSSGDGWQAGLFFGGNRNGTVGFMGEFNVQARKGDDSTIYYFQVPALLRLNFGSSSSSGASGSATGASSSAPTGARWTRSPRNGAPGAAACPPRSTAKPIPARASGRPINGSPSS